MAFESGFVKFKYKLIVLYFILLFRVLVGGEKSGRARYRYGFPAAEETRLRGRDTGQTRRAYSSFFSAEDRAQYL